MKPEEVNNKTVRELRNEYAELNIKMLDILNKFKDQNESILQFPTEIRFYLSETDNYERYYMYFKLELK
ncbi:MAG: hypothetical protein V3V72_13530 [Ignavibacteriaceae bacterium]